MDQLMLLQNYNNFFLKNINRFNFIYINEIKNTYFYYTHIKRISSSSS